MNTRAKETVDTVDKLEKHDATLRRPVQRAVAFLLDSAHVSMARGHSSNALD